MPAETIAFAGTVTRKEFDRVQSQSLPTWARWYVLYPVLAVVFLVVTVPGAQPSELLGDLGFVLLFPIGMAMFTRRVRTRTWNQAMRLGGRVHGAITPEGIEWNTDRTAIRFEWAKIIRIKRTDDLALAFHTRRCAFFFPRSFFATDAHWEAFNRVIAAYVPA